MRSRLAISVGIIVAIVVVVAVTVLRALHRTETVDQPAATQTVPAIVPKPAPVAPKPASATFTIGKETTYVSGPVDKNGYMDYLQALNERLGKGVTPETNANVLIWQALGPTPDGHKRMPAKFFELMGMEEPPPTGGTYFIGLNRFVRERLGLPDFEPPERFEAKLSAAARHPWSAEDYPRIDKWLKANEKPLALVVEASKRSDYFSPVVDSSILVSFDPAQSQCRVLSTALASRAMLKVSDGKYDEAWQDLLACHRLARLLGRSSPYMWRVVGISIDNIAANTDVALLERGDLSSDFIQACARDLHALAPMPSMSDCVDVGERFQFLCELMMVARHGLWYVRMLAGNRANNLKDEPAENINWDPALRMANQWFDRVVAAMREKDRPTRQRRFDQIAKEVKELKARFRSDGEKEAFGMASLDLDTPEAKGKICGELLFGLIYPPIAKYQIAADRADQQERNLHLAFALAAYRSDHKAYPKSLDALVPKYMEKVPVDLFTGKPLIYRPTEKGYLLYSLGPNGKDDAGRGKDDTPKGDDIAVLMPVPKPVRN